MAGWTLAILLFVFLVLPLGGIAYWQSTKQCAPPVGSTRQSNKAATSQAGRARARSQSVGRALDTSAGPAASALATPAALSTASGTIQQQRTGVLTLAERALLNSDRFAQRVRLQSDIDTVRGADSSDPERIFNPNHYLRSQINQPLTEVGGRITLTTNS